ncbi:N-6 DNA methylase [Campylobacter sp. MIT 99-7217]|uniref:N-6 DNA methylase n=1 Tax=Campylobacter sp. MIT 99-7217 TaxID=535091 RepID=UPI0011575586|nr:N-6 DNA methylase [Campylobacter sp. MIT 99-7217]TQR32331.1 N-6 DNA methylase [Campylobacter sp. MIT 99-7217]
MTQLELKFNKEGKIYSHIRAKYLVATPEEIIRQKFVLTLVNNYKYDLAQMDEEVKTKYGKGTTRADIVIWQSIEDKQTNRLPFIVVECKADNIRISEDDYAQGESYARTLGAPFFITHNSYETRFWRILEDKVPGHRQEISNIPENKASKEEIEKLFNDLVAFKEDEFATKLHKCHNIIRNMDKLAPTEAFDEISKILFMKVYVERDLLKGKKENKFTVQYFEEAKKFNVNPLESLFSQTKKVFAKDEIFEVNEKIKLKESTILRIVEELEKYNLSLTSTDIKGIAFEKFLGSTLRGELGQFFTPRSVVDFMIEMINPRENEICCDPASGSGGFLIRIFSKIKEDIQKDLINQYEDFKLNLIGNKKEISQEESKKLNEKWQELQKELDNENKNTRLFKLSNSCIFGTDANDRMARTSKMNMIMHGDGHGGIHHHNGLLNVNGIFENRFDIILTNPPFGSQVEKDEKILEKDSQLKLDSKGKLAPKEGKEEYIEEYYKIYGKEIYQNAQRKILDNIGEPIASLFELKENLQSDKTEHLFINRCLDLLKPSGRLGIVLPEGVFNTPNASYVRKFVEGKAYLRAVISLPTETFISAKASVKCSILFLQKFSKEEQERYNELLEQNKAILESKHEKSLLNLEAIINYRRAKGEESKYTSEDKKRAKKELKELKDSINNEALQKTKEDFDYPIFMAEADFAGITSTGETGANVPNDFIDIYEEKDGKEFLKQKGIASHFKDFLKEYNINWGKNE